MSNKYYQNISNFQFNKPCIRRNRQKLQEYEMLLSISKLMQ